MKLTVAKILIGLKPIVNTKTRVLILGSFPGVASLKKREYYGYLKNQFWRILSDLLQCDLTECAYKTKTKFLLSKGVGLWDMVASCKREGSSDSEIKEASLNDIKALLHKYPNIKAIFLNGKTAQNLFNKSCRAKLHVRCAPSTSPAFIMPYKVKKKKWSEILRYI